MAPKGRSPDTGCLIAGIAWGRFLGVRHNKLQTHIHSGVTLGMPTTATQSLVRRLFGSVVRARRSRCAVWMRVTPVAARPRGYAWPSGTTSSGERCPKEGAGRVRQDAEEQPARVPHHMLGTDALHPVGAEVLESRHLDAQARHVPRLPIQAAAT